MTVRIPSARSALPCVSFTLSCVKSACFRNIHATRRCDLRRHAHFAARSPVNHWPAWLRDVVAVAPTAPTTEWKSLTFMRLNTTTLRTDRSGKTIISLRLHATRANAHDENEFLHFLHFEIAIQSLIFRNKQRSNCAGTRGNGVPLPFLAGERRSLAYTMTATYNTSNRKNVR